MNSIMNPSILGKGSKFNNEPLSPWEEGKKSIMNPSTLGKRNQFQFVQAPLKTNTFIYVLCFGCIRQRLVWKVPLTDYHDGPVGTGRPDRWYRLAKKDVTSVGTSSDGYKWAVRSRRREGAGWHELGGGDLAAPVLMSNQFSVFPNDLAGAPLVPESIENIFGENGWDGYGAKSLKPKSSAIVRQWLGQVQ